MSNEGTVAVILRLAGIWMGLSVFYVLANVMRAYLASPQQMPLFYVAVLVVWLALTVALILKPDALARILLPKAHYGHVESAWHIDELQSVLFGTVGLFLVAITITNISSLTTAWAVMSGQVRPSDQIFGYYAIDALTFLLRLAVGAWLLFGAKGLQNLVRKVRRAGTE